MKQLSAVILLVLFSTGVIFSQLSLKLGPIIGMTSPTIDYSGSTQDFYAGTKYGMSSGINYGIMAKLSFLSLNGRFSVTYATLKNDGIANQNNSNSTVSIENNIVQISVGPEFSFSVPQSPVKPYGGIDLLFTSFSGSSTFKNTANVTNDQTISMQSSSRTGLGFSIGTEILFGKVNLDLSLRYNLHNLFGKEYKSANTTSRTDVYSNLNDGTDPNYSAGNVNHPVGVDRTIATIQIQLGLLFGL